MSIATDILTRGSSTDAKAYWRSAEALLQSPSYKEPGRVALAEFLARERLEPVVHGFLLWVIEQDIRSELSPMDEATVSKALLEGLMDNGSAPYEAMVGWIDQALTMAHDYLLQPERFLLEFLTESTNIAQLGVAFLAKLKVVREYAYLTDVLREWADRSLGNGTTSVSREQLASTIRKIDRAVIHEFELHTLSELLAPMFRLSAKGRLPGRFMAKFFLDKGASALAAPFEKRPTEELTRDGAVRKIGKLFEPRTVTANGTETATLASGYQDFLKELREAGVQLVPQLQLTEESLIERAEAQQRAAATIPEQNSPMPTSQRSVSKQDPPKPPEPATKPAHPATEHEVFPMERYIPAERRRKLIEKLFRGQEENYERSIALLNKAENWKQASVYLDAIFLRNKIKPDSKQALKLADAAYERFTKRMGV